MSYTSFGEFVRIQRIKHHEVMADMANFLGVKLPFLSAVENGKKNVPAEWINKIAEHYGLSGSEYQELKDSIEESKTHFKISTENTGLIQRRAAMQFARSFSNIDDATAEKILALLKNNTKDN